MAVLLSLLKLVGIIAFLIWIIKVIINSATNIPSWKGIIISVLLGMLPFYLFLCWLGWMGDERNRYDY